MISVVMHCSWLNLKRDRVALALSFVLPVAFFSIFAGIFGGMGKSGDGGRKLALVLVDEDRSAYSAAFVAEVRKLDALAVTSERKDDQGNAVAYDEASGRDAVREGKYDAALILGKGMADSVGFGSNSDPVIRLYYDPANPMSCEPIVGMLQQVGMTAQPRHMMEQGLEMLEHYGGPLTEQQRQAMDSAPVGAGGQTDSASASAGGGMSALVPVKTIDVHADGAAEKDAPPNMVAYYAAGVGVMFLLFSMAGAGGGLLEESESGTLDRLLASRLGMKRLILGKWLFFAASGTAQLAVMFLWGAFAFGLTLFTAKHLAGFALITVPAALAAAAFGLFLATLAKSRAQLSGISTITILMMSAVGGSMIPRFVMPPVFDLLSRFTINGWAIDGYLKVFWHEKTEHTLAQAMVYILPEVGVLLLFAGAFLVLAQVFSRRWSAV